MTTKAEKRWMDCITQIGCVACIVSTGIFQTPGCPHHMLTDGGRRRGHLFTFLLCDPGHHQNPPPKSHKVPRHPGKAAFERAYGTEEQLLLKSRDLVEARFGFRPPFPQSRRARLDGVDIDRKCPGSRPLDGDRTP